MSTDIYIFMTSITTMLGLMVVIELVKLFGLFGGDKEKVKTGGYVDPTEVCGVRVIDSMPILVTDHKVADLEKRVNMLECDHGGSVRYDHYIKDCVTYTTLTGEYSKKCANCGRVLAIVSEDEYHELKAKEHLGKVTKKSDEGEVKS